MDIESKIWNYSNTGMKLHAFLDGTALCRSSIRRPGAEDTALDYCEAKTHQLCAACDTKFNAAVERAEASMQPSTGEVDYLPPAAEQAPKTHHYNALGGQKFIADRGWVNHCRVCQSPEGEGNHFHNPGAERAPFNNTDESETDMRILPPRPLLPKEIQILDEVSAGVRQTEIAEERGCTPSWVNATLRNASAAINARTTAEAVAMYNTAKAYLDAADLLERDGLIRNPVRLRDEHTNQVIQGLADILRDRARTLLSQ
jgi:DNA-binding CsgD family transcriptional regulator